MGNSHGGLVEIRRELLNPGKVSFRRDSDGKERMDVNGTPSGAENVVYNGTVEAPADWTVSGKGSEKPVADRGTGSRGWDTEVIQTSGQSVLIDKLSTWLANDYSAFRFWLRPKIFRAKSKFWVQLDDASNNMVGSKVNVEDYVPNMDIDVWQDVSIPMQDFNVGTTPVQKFRFTFNAVKQRHHFDDVRIYTDVDNGPYIYEISPEDDSDDFNIARITLTLVTLDTGWNNDSFANIANGLTNGCILRQYNTNKSRTIWSIVYKNNMELFGKFDRFNDFNFASSNIMVKFMIEPSISSLVVTKNTPLQFIVQDDLSGLTDMRMYAHYGVE